MGKKQTNNLFHREKSTNFATQNEYLLTNRYCSIEWKEVILK